MNSVPNASPDSLNENRRIVIILIIAVPLIVFLFTSGILLSGGYFENTLKCSRKTNLCVHSIDRGIVDKIGLEKSIQKEFPVNSIKDTHLDRYYMKGGKRSAGRFMNHISLIFNNSESYSITPNAGMSDTERPMQLKATIDRFIQDKSINDLSFQMDYKKATEGSIVSFFWMLFTVDLLIFIIFLFFSVTKYKAINKSNFQQLKSISTQMQMTSTANTLLVLAT